MGVALQTVFRGVVYLTFTPLATIVWYNYQPLWCIVVIPWQNSFIHPRTMIQLHIRININNVLISYQSELMH